MICQRCLRQTFSLRSFSSLRRTLATTAGPTNAAPRPNDHPAATSTSAAQPFSTPLSSPADDPLISGNIESKPTAPKSSVPAGTPLKGLNYFKGKDDPVALEDNEYPDWLWRCLDSTKTSSEEAALGDEFSKSKKQRKLAAKRQRKLEAQILRRGGEALEPKIPLQEQSINLPFNTQGTVSGELKAMATRDEVKKAMRSERRAKIKETNYLKSM